MNKDNFSHAFAEHEKYKMNLARIKRKKVPVVAGRSNALPPLDAIDERDKLSPMPGEGYSTVNEKTKENNLEPILNTKANASKSIISQKATTNPSMKQKSVTETRSPKEVAVKDLKS